MGFNGEGKVATDGELLVAVLCRDAGGGAAVDRGLVARSLAPSQSAIVAVRARLRQLPAELRCCMTHVMPLMVGT